MKENFIIVRYLILSMAFNFICISVIAQTSTGRYKVNPEVINHKPISPLIYGHFIELGFGRQIEGMWAEKLYNSSFEIVEPFKTSTWGWLRKTPADDLTKEEWWHSGYEECKWFAMLQDGQRVPITFSRYSGFHHGLQAATLDNRKNQIRAYLAQDSVWLNKGISNIFKGYLKINRQNRGGGASALATANGPAEQPLPVNVTIGLYPARDFSHPLVEQTVQVQDPFYMELSVELNHGTYEGRTTFAVSIDGGVSASFDGFSLMPTNNAKGWRNDVVAALKQIGIPIIRFPGGCFASFYHWRNGIGPKLDRMPVNSEYWGDIEENNVGTAEFVELCRLIGCEPFVGVNMLTGTASEAADWVAYNNGVSGDRMSELRIEHGYKEPLKVKYWELDNETSRRWGYEAYARKCVEYSKAMKAVDPTIELVMVYYSFRGNLGELLDIAGEYIDLITDRSGEESPLKGDLEILAEYNKEHGTNIRLCNTEWLAPQTGYGEAAQTLSQRQVNTRMTRQEHQISWNYAMNTVYRLLIFQRLGNDFLWSNFNNLANTWGQNIIECPKDTVFISSAGRVFELMSKSKSAWVLKTDTLTGDNGIYLQATTTANKDKLIFYILNYHSTQSRIDIDLSAFKVTSREAEIKTISAEGPFSANTSLNFNTIMSSDQITKLNNPRRPVITVKPWSVTEITLNL